MKTGSCPLLLCITLLSACGGSSAPPPPDPAAVGPAGGTVTSSDGLARLEVPAGALSTSVSLVVRATTAVPLDPHAVGRFGYEISPAGTGFAIPATLTLRYDPARGLSGTDEAGWRLHALDAGSWALVPQGVSNPAAHEASGPVQGGGTYGVVWLGPDAPCDTADDHAFDFWLGHWDFSAAGSFSGSNDITSEAQGCLVEEHFVDRSGAHGRSTSLFSRLDGHWHQTYIDTASTRLVLIGGLEGSRMVLYQSPNERSLWELTAPDVVRFWAERSSNGGVTWNVTFDSEYTR